MNVWNWFTIVMKDGCVGYEEPMRDRFLVPGQEVVLRFDMCVDSEVPLVFFVLRVPVGGHKGLPTGGSFPYKSQLCFTSVVWKDKYVFKVNLGRGVKPGERVVIGFWNESESDVFLEVTGLLEVFISY